MGVTYHESFWEVRVQLVALPFCRPAPSQNLFPFLAAAFWALLPVSAAPLPLLVASRKLCCHFIRYWRRSICETILFFPHNSGSFSEPHSLPLVLLQSLRNTERLIVKLKKTFYGIIFTYKINTCSFQLNNARMYKY